MGGLYQFTFAINFLGFILTVWLGIYLVAHSIRYGLAWLNALTMWSLAGLFLNLLLALDPPQPISWPSWLRLLFLFWPECAFTGQTNCWLEGWLFVPSLALWHHVTILMLPGKLTLWHRGRILAGYAGVFCAIILQSTYPILYTTASSNPLLINGMKTGPLYPFFVAGILVFTLACLANLFQGVHATPAAVPRRRLMVLIWVTLIAGLVGPLSIAGSAFQQAIPMVAYSLVIAIPIGLFGYGVVSYSAAMEGRTSRRDFLYNLALLVIVVGVYLLAGWVLITTYRVSTFLLVMLPGLAVVTHSLISPVNRIMDRLFYRSSARQMRSNLRRLIHLAGEGKAFEDHLGDALRDLCTSVSAAYGLIVLFEAAVVRKVAACRFSANINILQKTEFACDDIETLSPGRLPYPLEDAAILIPLYAEDQQVGALVLGCPENGAQYSEVEVDRLLELADHISDVIYIGLLKSRTIRQLVEQAETQHRLDDKKHAAISPDVVELALRNLHDYAYLADSPLARLTIVENRLAQREATHLERGKTVHGLLRQALEKLCPESNLSRDPPPREWYSYLILRDAYLEEIPNRDIMLRLYISEGTFNRTRRAAIRSVARALGEMEATLDGYPGDD